MDVSSSDRERKQPWGDKEGMAEEEMRREERRREEEKRGKVYEVVESAY